MGCVRFSYVPPGARTPRRFRCQPDLAAEQAIDDATRRNPSLSDVSKARLRSLAGSRVRPAFTDRRYGRPAYMPLARSVDGGIPEGADDEGPLGALHTRYETEPTRVVEGT